MNRRLICVYIVLSFFQISSVWATIVLPKIFTNNMVLQQKADVPIWGKANVNTIVKISTSWNRKTYTTKADETGKWKIIVKTPKAGGPYQVIISDEEKLKLDNVLIGEVWVCSGQSNMEMPLADWGQVLNFKKEISSANYPRIRLFQIKRDTSREPLEDLKSTRNGWEICSSETVADFSAVAYFYGKNLFENLNVPIGLISTSWGGTLAEAWTSGESLENMPYFCDKVKSVKTQENDNGQILYEQKQKEWNEKVSLAAKNYDNKNKFSWSNSNFDDNSWNDVDIPGLKEDSLFSGFDGIIWFRKVIDIPLKWVGKELELNMTKIDDNDITYFNGVKIGQTNGISKKRQYKIPVELIKQGKAVITVRVTDMGGLAGFFGGYDDLNLTSHFQKDEVISLGGKWKALKSVDFSEYKVPKSPMRPQDNPSVLFNAMVSPIIPYAMQGVIWYQGESNEVRPHQYKELFPLLIRDWRKQWNRDFPFYFVQLANYRERKSEPGESQWPIIREAQLHTLNLANTGMAVTIDIGEANDIHPKNKQDVALRLALNAKANTYGEKNIYSGPIYDYYQIDGNTIKINFRHTDNGLKTKNNTRLSGFEIAGLDHKFYWANAEIVGDKVVVSSTKVIFPIAVRYGWADNPDCNLYNGVGLPASPFRTDDWERVSIP